MKLFIKQIHTTPKKMKKFLSFIVIAGSFEWLTDKIRFFQNSRNNL